MVSPFQTATLVARPSYPNSIAWSHENLVAIASGHLITILNPALLFGPRGLITIPPIKPFPIGVVSREDLLTECLLPTCLSRDTRPCARSIAWSPLGLAPNSGCILAVCTTEGRVKLYRQPFIEYCAEWVEVIDITDLLFDHLVRSGFGEADLPFTKASCEEAAECQRESACGSHLKNSMLNKGHKRRWVEGLCVGFSEQGLLVKLSGESGSVTLDARSVRLAPLWNCGLNLWQVTIPKIEMEDLELAKVVKSKTKRFKENNLRRCSSVPKHQGKSDKQRSVNGTISEITARQYVSCNAMLSSTVVAWSPMLHLSSESDSSHLNSSPSDLSLLSVGGKSGKLSLWRIYEPQRYSIVHNDVSVNVSLVGLLQAHNKWITSICWKSLSTNGSNSQVALATGSSDGSVKVWLVDTERLLNSSESNNSSICLLKEVTSASSAPVSVLSLTASAESPEKMLLAVGRGSGSLEVWICDISNFKFQIIGSYDAHVQVVTGLTWAFNGHCLYSCSQDDSVRSWVIQGSSLYEAQIPSGSLGIRSSTDLPNVSDSCFGLAISPGNLVIAVVRGLDTELLNQMYQARSQKAAVEFCWIGGQQLESSSDKNLELGVETIPGISEREMACWESNMLWSLKQYQHLDNLLVVWDVIVALFAVEYSAQNYVQRILAKWLSSWFAGCDVGCSIEKILLYASRCLYKISTRQLHLLNIICRRFVLSGLKGDIPNVQAMLLEGVGVEDERLKLWIDILDISERELRERLVAFSFAFLLSQASSSTTIIPIDRQWLPAGIAQMEQWVAKNHDSVQDNLKILASKLEKLGKRLHSICGYVAEEQCKFCSASAPFDSPEIAFCVGVSCNTGVGQSHKLVRCAASMQLCPTTPLWYCVCCQRFVSELAPRSLFTLSELPIDLKSFMRSSSRQLALRPLCPFCGILLQRLQPEFLISPSPV
ncbi:hypothetical protein AQUCO_01700014v1 [Aquilegia coerulea]|uniref:Transcription factor IIIC 90kDa subunit N-terminal domain-containing protein n=1 Tax=Aquilegia coerulea TaxID=218851 RepID=A0A2G5DKT3_AQUCA|nr:hypothetical protein AQUCO_01700014v1 [Aquilegia coerulea]